MRRDFQSPIDIRWRDLSLKDHRLCTLENRVGDGLFRDAKVTHFDSTERYKSLRSPLELAIYPNVSRNPRPLPFSTIPTYRQKLLYAVNESTRCVLSYDPAERNLVMHYWQVIMTSRITMIPESTMSP